MGKKLYVVLISLLISTLLIACSTNNTSEEVSETNVSENLVQLTFMVNHSTDLAITKAIDNAITGFEKENPNIHVEFISGVSDYEAVMKTRMAANDLPDLWATHGWSVARYSEYLRPLTDQPWASQVHPNIKNVITNDNGDLFVLPVDMDLSGIVYNVDVIEESGVSIDDINTWDDFLIACQKIKDTGYTPIHMGGKDYWTVANFLDWVSPSFYVTNATDNNVEELLNGRFDWNEWSHVCDLLLTLDEKGFLNKDKLSSSYSDSAKNLAMGKVGFAFYGNYVIGEARRYNTNANLSFMPVPSVEDSDEKTLISGERSAYGIWKDTEHEEEALLLLQYFTKPEVMKSIATASALPAGLKGGESDTGQLSEAYEKYSDLRGYNYFDRAYLPSGMWETMESTATGLLAGDMSVEEVCDKMETDYLRLIEQ